MKLGVIIIAFVLFTAACHSPLKPIDIRSTAQVTPDSINTEYFDWKNARINDTIPMICHFDEAVKVFGKPDSIAKLPDTVNGAFYHKKFLYCYFRSITFEKYNDTLVFSELNFSKPTNYYITDGKLRIDKWSTYNALIKVFPSAFANNRVRGTDMDKNEYLFLSTSRFKTNDDWSLTFHTESGKIWAVNYDDPHTNK